MKKQIIFFFVIISVIIVGINVYLKENNQEKIVLNQNTTTTYNGLMFFDTTTTTKIKKVVIDKPIITTVLKTTTTLVKEPIIKPAEIITTTTKKENILTKWGLGVNLISSVSNDRSYNWYIDQADTGSHSGNNCGPSSVIMALKWQNKNTIKSVEDARNEYIPEGGWWYPSEISNFLTDNASFMMLQNITENKIIEQLDNGKIIIVNVNMKDFTYNPNEEQRVDRFYSYSSGHFLIIKGYKNVDGNIFFEVYDPNNWHSTYQDGTPKGKNRYYRSSEMIYSINHWFDSIWVIN